jgi:hypothetical protein
MVDKITEIIRNSAINSELPRNKHSKSNLDFWTPELDRLRASMRTTLDEFNKYLKENNIGRGREIYRTHRHKKLNFTQQNVCINKPLERAKKWRLKSSALPI